MTAGVALAQEFTKAGTLFPRRNRRGRLPNRIRIPPDSGKVYGGSKQIAVSESAGASPIWQRRASRGCRASRPTGEALCRTIVLDRVLIADRVTTCVYRHSKYSCC
jgi:hypothetical protein